MAVVMTTLIVVSLITPLKNRLQAWMDRQFRELPAAGLESFGGQIQAYIEFNDPTLLSQRLLEQAASSLGAESGAVFRIVNGRSELLCSYGPWRGRALVSVPLLHEERKIGLLMLGPRRRNRPYERTEVEALAALSRKVAHAMYIGERLAVRPAA